MQQQPLLQLVKPQPELLRSVQGAADHADPPGVRHGGRELWAWGIPHLTLGK